MCMNVTKICYMYACRQMPKLKQNYYVTTKKKILAVYCMGSIILDTHLHNNRANKEGNLYPQSLKS